MANKIRIDLKALVAWTTATTYKIGLSENLVTEVGSNRLPSPAISTLSQFTTFADDPVINLTTPAYNTTSLTSTASLGFDRAVSGLVTGTNYYVRGSTGTITKTIPATSTNVSIDFKNVVIDMKPLDPETTYYLTADTGTSVDIFNFPSDPIVDDTVFKFTTGTGTDITSIFPAYESSGSFITTASIFYGRTITASTGNLYLNFENSGTVRTIPITSSSITTAGNAISVTLNNEPTKEGIYYITYDKGFTYDQYGLNVLAINTSTVWKWSNVILKDMGVRNYVALNPFNLFTATTPAILDIDLDPAKEYTLALTSPVATFTATTASTYSSSTWITTGTKTELNNLWPNIVIQPNVTDNQRRHREW